ncbi:MAG: hypothetical protein IJW39_05560 [Opitutales bacterium]|nr:hypothetical protein [Opitutales bacterium]
MANAAFHEKKFMNASGNEAHATQFSAQTFSGLSFFMDFAKSAASDTPFF